MLGPQRSESEWHLEFEMPNGVLKAVLHSSPLWQRVFAPDGDLVESTVIDGWRVPSFFNKEEPHSHRGG